MPSYCLGRLPAKPVALGDLTHYLTQPLPAAPVEVTAPDLAWPMADNDRLGDCVIAGAVHTDQVTAYLTDEPWGYPGDGPVEAEYFKLTGGGDTGLVLTDVLRVWQRQGLFGCKLAAFAPLAVKHAQTLKQAVWLCGATYMGVVVTATDQQRFGEGMPWIVTDDSDYIGGHCIPYVGYTKDGPIAVTWGALVQISWGWHAKQCEEGYAVITAEVKKRGSLRGLNFPALEADLRRL